MSNTVVVAAVAAKRSVTFSPCCTVETFVPMTRRALSSSFDESDSTASETHCFWNGKCVFGTHKMSRPQDPDVEIIDTEGKIAE